MVTEFKVGDTLQICAAVHDFCGYTQLYFIDNVNISKYPAACQVMIDSSPCLPLSGVEIEFTFRQYDTVLKSLGRRTTDSNGVVSISYILTEEDAQLYNNNNGFNISVCLTGTGPNYPTSISMRCKSTSDILIRGRYIGNACAQRNASICLNDETLIAYENPIYADGTITEACVYRAGSSAILPEGKIKVFRLSGNVWNFVGESHYLPIQNDNTTRFTGLNIIVNKGDYIGLYIKPSTYDACISCNSGLGLYYAKSHLGDVFASTNDSEWTNVDKFRVSINATLVPCQGVICPNVCVGFDLYSQICDPINGCIQSTLIERNSSTCGYVSPGIEKHYLYFEVSTLFPISYVIAQVPKIFSAATNAILRFISDYYIEAVDFDPNRYIITVTITRRLSLMSSPMSSSLIPLSSTPNPRIESLPIFLVIIPLLPYIALLIAALVAWLLIRYLGSESVTGEPPSTRIVRVTPTTSATEVIKPTFPILVEYTVKNNPYTIKITDGNPITFSIPTNTDIKVTVRAENNPYYKITTVTVPQCAPGTECPPEYPIVAVFTPTADAALNPSVKDSQGNPMCGSYIILEETLDGSFTQIKKGDLIDGKIPEEVKVIADVKQCIWIIPCDLNIYIPTTSCYKKSAGETEKGDITVQKCLEVKNSISVRTVYIAADKTRQEFIAEKIDIKLDNTLIKNVIPTSNITLISGLEKNTTYKIYVTRSGYDIKNNGLSVTFGNTDCDIKDAIIEADPPSGTYDITVEVRSKVTATLLQGANVSMDGGTPKITGVDGMAKFTSIPPGNHHFKITLNGYKTLELDYNVTKTETISKSLEIEEVYASIDTRIIDFAPSTGLYANSMVKLEGYLEYRDGDKWKRLTDATITISLKKDTETIKTFTAVSSSGILSPGYFETSDWLISKNLANTDINVRAEFAGVGRYKPSFYESPYHIGEECAIKNPITGECLISPMAGYGFMFLIGLGLLGIVMISRPGGAAERIIERYAPPPKEEIKALPSLKE